MKELVAAVGAPLLEQQPKRPCRLSPRVVWVQLARWDSILGPGWSPLAPPTSSAGIPEGKRSSRRTRGKAPASPQSARSESLPVQHVTLEPSAAEIGGMEEEGV